MIKEFFYAEKQAFFDGTVRPRAGIGKGAVEPSGGGVVFFLGLFLLLWGEGFSPNVDSDGDVVFKYEGGTYYIIVHENDPQYFNINYAGFWEIESPDELIQAAVCASVVTRSRKVVKVYLNSDFDNVSISAEILLKSPADFSAVLSRLMGQIIEAKRNFIDEMRSWDE